MSKPLFSVPINGYFKWLNGPNIFRRISSHHYVEVFPDGTEEWRGRNPVLTAKIEEVSPVNTPSYKTVHYNHNYKKKPFFAIPISDKFLFSTSEEIFQKLTGYNYVGKIKDRKGKLIIFDISSIMLEVFHWMDRPV